MYPHDTEADRGLLEDACNHWVQEMENAKWPMCLRMFANIAFLMGNQYPTFTWNQDTSNLVYGTTAGDVVLPLGVEQAIPKTVDNKLIQPYQSLISLYTEIKPEPRVEPASNSPEDEDTAQIAAIIHDLKWEKMKMPARLRQAGSILGTMGTVVAETCWSETGSPTTDPVYEMVEKTNPLTEEVYHEPVETGEEEFAFSRDVVTTMWTPFHFQPDPGATEDGESMEWCYRHHFVDIGWVYETFTKDEEGYFLTDDDSIGGSGSQQFPIYWYERIKDLIDTPDGMAQFSGRLNAEGDGFAPNQTLLRVWDIKPNRHFPEGRTLIQAGDKLIYAGKARGWTPEYPKRWHKYAVARYISISGRFWGLAMLSTLLQNQKTINAIDSLEQLARELGTIGQWYNPKQANVQDGELCGIPATIIHYTANTAGAIPQKVPHTPLPPEYFVKREQCEKSIQVLGGMETFLAAEAPSAVRSGPVMDLMQKKSRQPRAPSLQEFSEFLETIGTNILIETALGMGDAEDPEFTNEIMRAARDRSSTVAVSTFQGTNLLANLNVRIDIASELLKSPEAKQQKAMDGIQYAGQMLSRPDVIKLLNIAGLDEFGLEASSDYRRAKRMISVVANGDVGVMDPWPGIDDPEIFQGLLKQEIQSDRMITYEPEVQQEFLRLYQMYSALLQQQQLAQMEQALMMQRAANEADRDTEGAPSNGKAQ